MFDDALTDEFGEPYTNPPCDLCCSETNSDGDCEVCEPRVGLEYSPVRASFVVAEGRVTEVLR